MDQSSNKNINNIQEAICQISESRTENTGNQERLDSNESSLPVGPSSETSPVSLDTSTADQKSYQENTVGQNDNQTLTTKVADLEEQIVTLRNDYLRALADAQNAQARADRRIEQNAKYAITNFIQDLVSSVADNLGRALRSVPSEARFSDNKLLDGLATGIEMTEKSLLELLERHGVRRIDPLNHPFNANLHYALQEIEDKSLPTGTIVQVLQEGYMLHDRLIRPATVVVTRGGLKKQSSYQESVTHQVCDEKKPQQEEDNEIGLREERIDTV